MNRKPFQGISNVVQFNYHYYLMMFLFIGCIIVFDFYSAYKLHTYCIFLIVLSLSIASISLGATFFIYDKSNLYDLNFLENCNDRCVLNIHAGFDEISQIIKEKFPKVKLTIADFYNPDLHTEISIKRARQKYSILKDTIAVDNKNLFFQDNVFESCIVFMSAHEIRNFEERVVFFKELKRVIKHHGSIIVVEHLRDINNFLAFNIGFFHFYSHSTWYKIFKAANFNNIEHCKFNPFISIYKLSSNGIPS